MTSQLRALAHMWTVRAVEAVRVRAEAVADARWQRHIGRRRDAASDDPRWLEIEALRGVSGAVGPDTNVIYLTDPRLGLTTGMWAEQRQIERRGDIKAPIEHRIRRRLRRLPDPLRHPLAHLRHCTQRARRGFSDRDLANFDLYLAGVIAAGVVALKARTRTTPEDLTEAQWHETLEAISEGYASYVEGSDTFGGDVSDHKTQRAQRLLAARFGDLWA